MEKGKFSHNIILFKTSVCKVGKYEYNNIKTYYIPPELKDIYIIEMLIMNNMKCVNEILVGTEKKIR